MEALTRKQMFPDLSKLNRFDVEYYLFFIIIECGEAFNKGSSNQIYLAFAAVGVLFLGYKLLDTKYEFRELFSILLLSILGIFIFYNTNKAGGFLSIIALIGLKGVDIRKLLKLSFFIRLGAFLLLLFLTSFDIIQNMSITQYRGDSTIIRYFMGFSHPNQFHLSFIIILLLFIYIYYDRLGIIPICIFAALNVLVYFTSYSRTSTLIGFLALGMLIWFKSNLFPKVKQVVCLGIIPFGFLISIIPPLIYDKISYLRTIDRLLQWRITFSKHYLDSYPLRLFGNNVNSDPIVLDSGYVELIINYGLIFTLLYIAAYMILIYRYVKMRRYNELLFIVCLSLYGITESFIPNLFINLSMIFMGELIFNSGKKVEGYE